MSSRLVSAWSLNARSHRRGAGGSRWHRRRWALALSVALSVPTGALLAAPVSAAPARTSVSAAAAAGDFRSSFEAAEANQPLVSTVEKDGVGVPIQHNVTGAAAGVPGSLLDRVIAVTASDENAPGELAVNLTDRNSGTKWLVFATSGWVTYQLAAPSVATVYSLTSANDAPERDPRDWAIQGSTDGSTWTDLDTQTSQTFSARFITRTFTFANTTAYGWYRLNVTANGSGGLIQLADWDLGTGDDTGSVATPMVTVVGSGPVSGYNMKPLAGFTGMKALRYSGSHTADGRGYATNRLFDVSVPVGAHSRLTYRIFPELSGRNLQYPSTFTAVDLHFTDGSFLSGLKPVDTHETSATAAGQGAGKILYADQWNAVAIDLGPIAAGRTIDQILLSYDNTGASKTTTFQGWLDDVTIAANPTPIDPSSLTNFVDTRRGTNASGSFSRGNNLPIAARPNGFTFLTPVTAANSQSWQYYYQQGNNDQNRPVLQGLAVSHEPSPWMGDRNQMSVMPSAADGVPTGSASGRGLAFGHDAETAQPDYYKVALDNGITAEVTPGDHGGDLRFTFPETLAAGHVVVDTVDNNGAFAVDPATGELTGWVDNGSGLSAGRSRMFVYGTFDRAPTAVGTAPGGHTGTRYATFDTSTSHTVVLELATSFISLDQARRNHALELAPRTFDQLHADATEAWNGRLGRIDVQGANETQKRTLYSNLYRLNLYPNSQFENTGTAAAPHYQYASPVSPKTGVATTIATNAKLVDGKIYVNNGFWDTYRTVWPAYSLLYPDVAAEIADGFVQQYRDGGWIARWSSPGYADLMTGTSSDVAMADAYLKGVDLPDPLSTYDAAVKNATVLSARSAVGRKGLDSSIFLGYTSTNTGESVSWALEGFINDFGIGNMAAALSVAPATPENRRAQLQEESAYFLERARNYVHLFNPDTDFFQGRTASGGFTPDPATFDPEEWGGVYTETDGWNFAFHAPDDGNGLANLYGGRDALRAKLDTFFATPETATKPGGYGGTIHEMIEARDVRLGQLGMSNQVSHHIPYMYDYVGKPAKTAEIVREILRRLYVGDEIGQGYPGDEDNGEMSSWYLLSTLGFYPLQVGSGRYAVGSPQFSQVTVHRPGGDLVVNAANNSATNIYVQNLSVNGTTHPSTSIDTKDLLGAARLDFTMGATPSTWGTAAAAAPPSLTTGTKQPMPLQDLTGPNMGTAAAVGGQDAGPLFDDSSLTQVTFANGTPQVSYQLTGGKQQATFYTLTSGANPGDPTSWQVQGSTNGTTWTTIDTRTAQVFPWRTQTRPFQIAHPGKYQQYRLVVTATTGAATTNLAEVEFLSQAPQTGAGPIRVTATTDLSGSAGATVSGEIALVGGGGGTKASDYTVTIDWNDRSAPTRGVLAPARQGNYAVTASHTYAAPGYYRPTVTVRAPAGQKSATGGITVHYALASDIVAAFDSVCFGNAGTEINCDADGAGLSRAALADAGGGPGQLVGIAGTDLHFVIPVVPPGADDNATGAGQTVPLTVPADATRISVIGTATQKDQDTVATLKFTDGSTAPLPIQFGDWCGDPKFGNLIAIRMAYRLNGTGTDGCHASLWATAPLTLPAGKTVASIVLPTQTGDPHANGRIHVFAVADNGAPVAFTPNPSASGRAGVGSTVTLGTVTGGVPGTAGYSARVQWGDGSVPENAKVSAVNGAGVATVTAVHHYRYQGSYRTTVVVADSRADVTSTFVVTVGPLPATTRQGAITTEQVGRTGRLQVRGDGFAPGERVTLRLGTGPVSRAEIADGAKGPAAVTVTASPTGTVSALLTAPAGSVDGLYSVTAVGTSSTLPATGTLVLAEPQAPRVYTPEALLSRDAGPAGDVLRVDGHGFASNEKVDIAFDGTVLETVKANADGIVTDVRVGVPGAAGAGAHQFQLTGRVSGADTVAAFTVRR